jgi:hypothetical protein
MWRTRPRSPGAGEGAGREQLAQQGVVELGKRREIHAGAGQEKPAILGFAALQRNSPAASLGAASRPLSRE